MRKIAAFLVAISSVVMIQSFSGTVYAKSSNSVTCTKPNWANPGQYNTTTGLNDAQTLAIECAKKLWTVTSKTGGQCLCFAELLIQQIGDNQIRYVARRTDAGPRWKWITQNPKIDQWSWSKRPTFVTPQVIWWNNISDTRGHVGIYIGTTRLGKPIYIDNLSRNDGPCKQSNAGRNCSTTGFWAVGESNFVQRKVPQGVTRNFIGVLSNTPPGNCL